MWGQVEGKTAKNQKKKYSGQQQKEMDWDEPHPVPSEKMQPIQWTKRPTGALVTAGSLWPFLVWCLLSSIFGIFRMVCQISGGLMEMPELSGPRLPGSATGLANKAHLH